jgi:hypothetical protein
MEANVARSYDEVSQLIADAIGVDIGRARVYYRHKVINGIAKGYDPNVRPWESKGRTATAQAPKFAKTPKAIKAKLEKSVRAINTATKAKAKAELNVDEIAKIKEANLARMKEVSAKLKPKNVRDYGARVAAPEGDGVAHFDPTLAHEEVRAILRDERLIDVCPKFVREDV